MKRQPRAKGALTLVATLKTTSIGATVVADIHTVQDQSLTGAQKFEQVVANTAPLVLSYVTGGGLSAFIGDAEDIARELVQLIFNDTLGAAMAGGGSGQHPGTRWAFILRCRPDSRITASIFVPVPWV